MVLIFPPRLAAITPPEITIKRTIVIPISRVKITTVIHHGMSPKIESPIMAVPTSALSAMGSSSFPSSVTLPRLLANLPSMKSVMPTIKKSHQATIRQVESWPPFLKRKYAHKGSAAILISVIELGKLSSLGFLILPLLSNLHLSFRSPAHEHTRRLENQYQ